MRILVTGSEGTLGKRLVKALERRGHNVLCCDLQHIGRKDYIRADVGSFREIERAFSDCAPDAVYHLAAEFGRHNGEGWYERVWTTNAIGTRHILQLCEEYDSRLIFASSSEIYGEAGEDWLREDLSETTVLHQPNEYALSKWVNEVQIRNFAARSTMPTPIVCRFFNAYGPGERFHDYRSVVALFAHRLLHGEEITVFRGYHRTFMFVDDFIPTLASVVEVGQPGAVYNIGGRDYRSVEELAEIVLAETSAPRSLLKFKDQDAHNVVSKRPDISRAEADLRHDPKVLLEQGVPLTLDWMRNRAA